MTKFFQIQQKSLNGYDWFVAGLAETLTEGLDVAEAMLAAYKKDAPWMELRVVQPGVEGYIKVGESFHRDLVALRKMMQGG